MAETRYFNRSRAGRIAAAALCALAAGAGLAGARAQAQQPKPVQLGEIVIVSQQIDYDLEKNRYTFAGKVDLRTRTSHLAAERMTVQMTEQNELEWARCEGDVLVERKSAEDGSTLVGRGRILDYREREQKANLQGDVVVHQSSPRLAKPAVVTGERVDLDLKTRENVVVRGPGAQAKVRVEPKGQEGGPTPEPVELVADRIEMNGETQLYVATGKPVLARPSSKLQAKQIRFQVDPASNEVKAAYADGDMVFDGRSDKGTVIHATGSRGVYTMETRELMVEGGVRATVRDPKAEQPTVYQGHRFTYDTVSGRRSLIGGPTGAASIVIPERKPQPASKAEGDRPAAAGSGSSK